MCSRQSWPRRGGSWRGATSGGHFQRLEGAAGAYALLLIVAALDSRDLGVLHERALALGLDVLVEVHDVNELQAAVDAGARLIGVNNRNLRSLDVNLAASEEVMARMPQGAI